jgi:hypothetical protein
MTASAGHQQDEKDQQKSRLHASWNRHDESSALVFSRSWLAQKGLADKAFTEDL